MNFVGHAHVALAVRDEPAFVLGAMLPDFASMCGARLVAPTHDGIAAGVALHHRTDEAFHACAEFVRLCAATSASLEARGIAWGAARAVAHVGIELLLDGLLLDDAATRDGYLRAVAALADPALSIEVSGRGAARWPAVRERAIVHGLPDAYRDPREVADRLIRILAPRPRLAVDPGQRPVLEEAMWSLRRDVERSAGELVAAGRSSIVTMEKSGSVR